MNLMMFRHKTYRYTDLYRSPKASISFSENATWCFLKPEKWRKSDFFAKKNKKTQWHTLLEKNKSQHDNG